MPTFAQVETALAAADRHLASLQGQKTALEGQIVTKESQRATLEALRDACEEAVVVLTSFGEARQAEVQAKIEGLVTYGLQTIFGEEMTFHITPGTHGANATLDFTIRSAIGGEVVETPVMDARGGGVAVVVGFLLRLLMISLRPDAAKVLVLDESFSHVSAEYVPALGEFIRDIAAKAGIQVIMVTHDPTFNDYADVVYRFSQVDGATVVAREGEA